MEKLNINKKNLKVIFQNKPLGLANAILLAENLVKGEDICVILPDDLIIGNNCTKELLKLYNRKKNNILGVMEVDKRDVSKYGIIEPFFPSRKNYKIKNLIEKPNFKNSPSNLAIVGRYILCNSIFKYIKKTKAGSQGELQLTDAIALSNKHNDTWGCKFSGKRYDCGNKLGFLKAQLHVALEDKEIKTEVKNYIKNLGV
ncbi:MAG: hypothetical protein CMP36_02530 [Rickettsiales bacterium]|nr:hypothetical protein [Rickettsiales bacterium]OUV80292.1 MAG: hypothetical protein CBC91_03145 [Rickettsiales bacterium TMED131]